MITFRDSTAADADRVMEIWRSSVDATHDFLSLEYRAELDDMLSGFLPTAPLTLAVNEAGNTVGFMLVSDRHLEALFIDPEYRGRGVGRMMLEEALVDRPDMTTDVNEQNHQAIGFYERMEFIRTGRSEVDGQGKPYPLIHLRYAPL
ncbi:acetyltransferase [Pararhizobium sp. PWRC1-1]|uniref:acetyltransferase n=1 Tax=Pararhizobium sp. PWRC1-1 TaxID=2804566 RepID=UPI003CF850AB